MQKPRPSTQPDILFYDGGCSLCHRSVRFVLRADGSGDRFRFAPLDSDAFRSAVSETDRLALPDSLVLLTSSRKLLIRTGAFLHILNRLGGFWRLVGLVLGLVPISWRDAAYDLVARRRLRWFNRPKEACPIVPPHLRSRFL